jgi:hypothetical protein
VCARPASRIPGGARESAADFRYLYVYYPAEQQIGLLYLLDKGDQEDLSAAERKVLRELALQGR